MRSIKIYAFASILFIPAAAAANPHCATAGPDALSVGAAVPSASPPALTSPSALSASLNSIPFVSHVASQGAEIIDLGIADGMHEIAARSGNQFMLFDIAPDGVAAVSGVPIELSVANLKTVAAGDLTDIGPVHGLDAYFVRSGEVFQVFYATPDQQRVIPGVMLESSCKYLTKSEIQNIPGAVPTVTVEAPNGGVQAAPADALAMMQSATSGTIGNNPTRHVYMLIDPQCLYSVRAFQMLKPFATENRIEISVIPLTILDDEDGGQSTRSAMALLSDPPEQIVTAWETGSETNPPSDTAADKLKNNMLIAQAIGLRATPTFLWRKADGSEGQLVGVPQDVEAFVAAIGS